MTFPIWLSEVDKILIANKAAYRAKDIDEDQLSEAFNGGESPVIFAKNRTHKGRPVPVIAPIIPVAQFSNVLTDPKYNLDTGTRLHCPVCGSSFIKPLGKPGTGMGYLGSVQWIVAASIFESFIKSAQKQPFLCGYCDATFTEDVSASCFAPEKELNAESP